MTRDAREHEVCARTDAAGAVSVAEDPPLWLQSLDPAGATRIDVRPHLAAGRDPFDDIMALACPLRVGGALIIEAPFDPVPLRTVLAEHGFETFAKRIEAGHWRLWCLRQHAPKVTPPARGSTAGGATVWREDDGIHIDVRGLPAPAPLVAIVRLIESGDHAGTVVAHLDRDPVHLYPELAERNWSATSLPGDANEVRLRLTKAPT
ncbi:conserved hypothetical protein [uncultured Defluviicoccus sp.]|uniref:DUF2249 domain-containing protein n=1 Tax=metagenome TaxID=256318 RepID=A0A380TB09_9ZZZZ|nr:conserved hypothetical protein [uncultured Defluviicoccus sp.]